MRPHLILLGFPVRFDTFALLLAAGAVLTLGTTGAVLVALFVGSILLHELGHAIAFRRYGCDAAIVIHAFGGMTTSYQAGRLTDREHITVSLAGPLSQLLVLGLPSLVALLVLDVSGLTWFLLTASVFLNMGWAVVNLLPMYPLDGGQVLFRFLRSRNDPQAWSRTRIVSILVAAPLAAAAFFFGQPIAAGLIGYTVYRGISGLEPGGRPSAIRTKAAAARAANKPLSTRGAAGDQLLDEAYVQLIAGNTGRLDRLVEVLAADKNRSAQAAELAAWRRLLDDAGSDGTAQPGTAQPGTEGTATAQAGGQLLVEHVRRRLTPTQDPASQAAADAALAEHMVGALDHGRFLAATKALARADRWPDVLRAVPDIDTLEHIESRLVSAGMAIEQMLVAREIRLRSEAGDQASASD